MAHRAVFCNGSSLSKGYMVQTLSGVISCDCDLTLIYSRYKFSIKIQLCCVN